MTKLYILAFAIVLCATNPLPAQAGACYFDPASDEYTYIGVDDGTFCAPGDQGLVVSCDGLATVTSACTGTLPYTPAILRTYIAILQQAVDRSKTIMIVFSDTPGKPIVAMVGAD